MPKRLAGYLSLVNFGKVTKNSECVKKPTIAETS